MKRILIMFICSFAFTGTFWLAHDNLDGIYSYKIYIPGYYDIDIYEEISLNNADPGITISYTHPVYSYGDIYFDVGLSYMIEPWKFPGGHKLGLYSFFVKPIYKINDTFNPWITLGLTKFTEELDDVDSLPEYGFGFDIKLKNKLIVEVGFSKIYIDDAPIWSEVNDYVNMMEDAIDAGIQVDYEEKLNLEKIVISIGYSL